ncbi:hypothetical protein IE00_15580 [Paracoccus sp. SM22M-07]|nr:hypothetical protein IE00_15580 [Paracoccus sp. SM22M-07]
MFVVRYLMAALATILGALVGGAAMGFSLWQSIGMAFLAMIFLQVLILGYVVAAAIRITHASREAPPRHARSRDSRQSRDQLFSLPK